eukprot:TRINITY_DN13604_c0_g1_i2.p1 TRINITY_DN13604_c0_g1~~TRINITY_DN13604_c0_g1_i2.p1  ORF type:complete len:135 (+),score=1.90 TRINITY_DN13604_c0_g1_i2:69-473(+)
MCIRDRYNATLYALILLAARIRLILGIPFITLEISLFTAKPTFKLLFSPRNSKTSWVCVEVVLGASSRKLSLQLMLSAFLTSSLMCAYSYALSFFRYSRQKNTTCLCAAVCPSITSHRYPVIWSAISGPSPFEC